MDEATKNYMNYKNKNSGSASNRYHYILNESDLTSAWLKFHNDLGYPLMTDSKYRRAIIYNRQGLEKQIEKMIANVIETELKDLADIVVADITYQLNNLTQTASGQLVKPNGLHTSSMGSLIGRALGKGLVNGFSKILDDMTDTDDRRYRR